MMKHPAIQLLTTLLIVIHFDAFAQPAPWVSYPSANQTAYGVFHFRKSFDLEKVPEKLVIHVSADNRYNLFVNSQRVCYGPAKGDLQTYKYDIIDIAPFLKSGENLLAALAYNGGDDKPLAFLSVQTAFMLRSEEDKFSFLNTGTDWKVYKNPAYEVISYYEMLSREPWFYGFYACGGGDEVFAEKYPWGWETTGFDDSDWPAAEPLVFDKQPPWNLVPRNIPFMAKHLVYPAKIRKVTGTGIPTGEWKGQSPLTVPAHTKAEILIDFEVLTMGYPELIVTGGSGSRIQIKYAEALYEKVNLKAHRDSVNNLNMFGVWDIFHPDGNKRTFRPLWKRCFRYVQFNVETKNEPLEIGSYILEYSGYPYPEQATFFSDNEKLNEILEMSLRTLQMCSGETSCWDGEKQLFRDYADREIFSQHTNIMAILCDLVPPSEQTELLHRILNFEGFEEMASSYFSFFLFKAMEKTGNEHLYLDNLDFWYHFIDRGHTTCGETGFASHDRSDCHAWSAHPAYFMLSSVCGIKPADNGFNIIKIKPHLGELKKVKADMPHPKGRIKVDYKQMKNGLQVRIILPPGMSGLFEFQGESRTLNEGANSFTL